LRVFQTHAKITKHSTVVGFEVLTVVVMKSTSFWDIMLCSLLKVNQCILLSFFDPEDGGDIFFWNTG
jgi:hypothetical protein